MKRLTLAALAIAATVSAARADEITDTLQSAMDAYSSGDVQYALEEIAYAQQLLKELKAGALVELLPAAPDGWTRTIDEDQNIAAMMGGGTGAAAIYTDGTDTVNVSVIMDSPMIAAMAGIFSNAAIMSTQGKLVRVGREKFLEQDRELTGLIDSRIMIRADGAATEVMVPILEAFDFRALGQFGR